MEGVIIILNGEMITDAELDIMKVLWENSPLTSPAIFEAMKSGKNRRTLKTLLARLVQKGSVRCEKINLRNYLYFPVITKEEYINLNRRRMIDKLYDGAARELIINFMKEEKITAEDLQKILNEIEED